MSVRSIETSCFRLNDNNYHDKETQNGVKLLKSVETYKCGCLIKMFNFSHGSFSNCQHREEFTRPCWFG